MEHVSPALPFAGHDTVTDLHELSSSSHDRFNSVESDASIFACSSPDLAADTILQVAGQVTWASLHVESAASPPIQFKLSVSSVVVMGMSAHSSLASQLCIICNMYYCMMSKYK